VFTYEQLLFRTWWPTPPRWSCGPGGHTVGFLVHLCPKFHRNLVSWNIIHVPQSPYSQGWASHHHRLTTGRVHRPIKRPHTRDWGLPQGAELLPSMLEAMGSIPSSGIERLQTHQQSRPDPQSLVHHKCFCIYRFVSSVISSKQSHPTCVLLGQPTSHGKHPTSCEHNCSHLLLKIALLHGMVAQDCNSSTWEPEWGGS
jgi:hypothetical protein